MRRSVNVPMQHPRNERVCAVLCYLVIGILWYLVEPAMRRDELVRFHARQGLACVLIASLVNAATALVPSIVGNIFQVASNAVLLFLLIPGMLDAARGKRQERFIVGELAKKLRF